MENSEIWKFIVLKNYKEVDDTKPTASPSFAFFSCFQTTVS
jgi:hypothetical protein